MHLNQQGCWFRDLRNPVSKRHYHIVLVSDCRIKKFRRGCAFYFALSRLFNGRGACGYTTAFIYVKAMGIIL